MPASHDKRMICNVKDSRERLLNGGISRWWMLITKAFRMNPEKEIRCNHENSQENCWWFIIRIERNAINRNGIIAEQTKRKKQRMQKNLTKIYFAQQKMWLCCFAFWNFQRWLNNMIKAKLRGSEKVGDVSGIQFYRSRYTLNTESKTENRTSSFVNYRPQINKVDSKLRVYWPRVNCGCNAFSI